jgi:cyclopropane-fatty-acyl-phospholipid synthase
MSNKHIDTLKRIFEQADLGDLRIYTPCDKEIHFQGNSSDLTCDLKIHDWSTMDLITKRGDIGLGEAYHLGLWDSSNLAEFLTYCSLNINKLTQGVDANIFNRVIFYFYNQFVRLNTKYGSKKNILEHYDIGNDFYSLWLDETMTYSSAIRNNAKDSLKECQLSKYNRIINKLDLSNQRVLEIGCGWGGFADVAAKAGVELSAITISDKQYEFAKKRLGKNANIIMQDYRDVSDKFQSIVSIEMFEAVGEKYWSTYFNQIKKSLIKGGRAMIQTITISDDIFPQYRKNSDYIRHHVFPGGMLPSKKVFCNEAQKAKLNVGEIFEFGHDYAWTLEQWQNNFNSHKRQLINMGYSSTFLRAWNFYLSLSIAGFKSSRTNVMQVELVN